MLSTLVLISSAHAFCGTYTGSPGDELLNETSRVVLAVDPLADTTTLTLDMDVSGADRDFGLVIPVPSGLDATSVRTVDRALLESIVQWSSPRTAALSCDDVETREHGAGCEVGCAADGLRPQADYLVKASAETMLTPLQPGGETAASTVTVESEFALAEYDIQVLSSASGEDLEAWLADEGFVMPAGADDLFESYLRDDAWFVAVRVRVDAPIDDGAWLTPLQFQSAGSDRMTVPIRVGTLSSKGQQEVLVHLVTDGDIPGLSTFPEATIDRDCLLPPDVELDSWYAQTVADAFDAVGGSGWILEHSWPVSTKCDPCIPAPESGPLTPDKLQSLGMDTSSGMRFDLRVSRIRVRYQTADVQTDLAFYDSGVSASVQTRLIEGPPELEYLFPVCNEGFADTPLECPDPVEIQRGSTLPIALFLGPLALLGAGLRRRST